jgi:glycosyltransferase involved in cell wall biosynthesis
MTMCSPDITIVLCTYDRPEMLRNALRSITAQETGGEFSYEIVVIDNASTDPTRAVVTEIAASSVVPVRYVREEAKGLCQAYNRGVREARGSWLAFFDDDQMAEPNWLKELLSTASLTKAKIVGGDRRLDLPTGKSPVLGPISRNLLGEHGFSGRARVCQGKRLPAGGNILIARQLFNDIGLFDTSMFGAGEDSDFVKRARASGAIVSIAPAAIVHHVIPPYRVAPSYLRWTSMRWGQCFAYIDYKNSGRPRMFACFAARAGQALLINLPLLIFNVLRRDAVESLDRQCLLWRAIGYTCGAAALAVPGLFRQHRLFSGLDLREERTLFSKSRSPG